MGKVQCRHYAFTIWPKNLNNKFSSLMEWAEFARDKVNNVKYLVYQLELSSDTRQLHVQGFVSWKGQKTPATTANFFGGIDKECFQRMKKGATPWDNKRYCTKCCDVCHEKGLDGDCTRCARVWGPHEFGEIPTAVDKPTGDQSRLETFIETLKEKGMVEAREADPSTYVRSHSGLDKLWSVYQADKIPQVREVTVYVACGTSGAGKSYWAQTWDTREHTFSVPDIRKAERLNLDGYQGERTLLIEDYDGAIEFRSLLKMLDVYKAQFNTKGAMVWGAWDTVLITTNVHPSQWYDDRMDPWGLEDKSPLKRRIHYIFMFSGVWEKGTAMVSVNGEPKTPTSWLHNRAATEAAQKALGDGSTNVGTEAASSNPPVQRNDSPTVEQLIEEWEEADQALANDFINKWGPASPMHFARTQQDEDYILNGEQGDGVTEQGEDLFGFTA